MGHTSDVFRFLFAIWNKEKYGLLPILLLIPLLFLIDVYLGVWLRGTQTALCAELWSCHSRSRRSSYNNYVVTTHLSLCLYRHTQTHTNVHNTHKHTLDRIQTDVVNFEINWAEPFIRRKITFTTQRSVGCMLCVLGCQLCVPSGMEFCAPLPLSTYLYPLLSHSFNFIFF